MNNATQSLLGRYRLVKVLGQGAMGVVYEAMDTRLGRTVAIKTVLRSHLVDENSAGEYASRFEREAQAAARLAHPNVVTVHDFGEHEDISYIVMEFVRGRELAEVFEAGQPLPLPQTLDIMRELLAALDYAHEQGVVHRDIKPANVMLDQAGHVKLTDFGVARVASATQDRTMPGTLVGTPSYMAPEQVLGLAVGSRADIFAAGVILYQCLTGKRPFIGGGPFDVQRKIVQDDPLPPSRLAPQLSAAFDLVIARALAKTPEDRYPTAAAFAQALEQVGAARRPDPPRSPPRAPAQPAAAPGALRRTLWPLLAGALVALLALAAWRVFVDSPWQPSADATPTASPPPAEAAPVVPSSIEPPPPPKAEPQVAPAAEPVPAPATEPAAAPAPAPGAQVREASTTPTLPAPRPRSEDRPSPAGPAATPEPTPPERAERREVLGARCGDLLQRMQIGEPLTPEQSQYFQTRCTR